MDDVSIRGILETVGNTPLVELNRFFERRGPRVFAKLERFNPGGSVKDRTALAMIHAKLVSGELVPGRSVVVESSSGNLAVGLAQVCRYFGLRFVCVVDAKTTEQNLALLHAFGAEVEVVTERDPLSGEYLPMRLARVRALVDTIPGAVWPNQYANPINPQAHERTMREIDQALLGRVDYLIAAVSTTGTLRGCATYIRRAGLPTRVVAVDALGSAIFGGPSARRLLPGHGASVVPPLFDPTLVDEVEHVSDLECVVACRRLAQREAILAGGSSGAVLAAAERVVARVPEDSTCVVLFPDGGDRYLDTIFSDRWVARHFGEISHLWKESPLAGVSTC